MLKPHDRDLDYNLVKWRGFLDELEIPFFINQSCALGIHREGHMFPNERVVELGVLGSDLTDEKLYVLETDREKYDYHYENSHTAPLGLLYFHDMELQPVYFKNGKAFYNLLHDTGLWFPEYMLKKENWGKVKYLDMEWNVPGDLEKFFECTYGDWKIPRSFVWTNDALNKVSWYDI